MITTAELLKTFHSMDSSRKARPLKIVDEEVLLQEEKTGQVAVESV